MGTLNSETQLDDNLQPLASAYEPTSDRIVIPQAASATQDPQTGRWYGPLSVSGSFSPPAVQRVDAQSGDFPAGAITDLATQLTLLQGAITSNKMATKAAAADIADLATLLSLAGTSGDAGTVASFMGRFTALKSDLDTLSGIVSGSKGAVKAGAGDFADLATLVTQTATPNISDRWARQVGQVDIARVLGAAMSPTNGVITETNLLNWLRNAQMYQVSTARLATATNANLTEGASLFNPSNSGKNILVISAKCNMPAATSALSLNLTTTDPAFATALTASNLKAGGAASALATSITCSANNATASVSVTGTEIDRIFINNQGQFDFITPGTGILLPSGSANGIAIYAFIATAGNFYGMTFRYIEF